MYVKSCDHFGDCVQSQNALDTHMLSLTERILPNVLKRNKQMKGYKRR